MTKTDSKPTTADIDKALKAEKKQEAARTIGGFDIHPVSEVQKTINILIYGEPGSGKTVLAGSAAVVEGMSPVLFIDIEGGTLSLQDFYPDVQVVRVSAWKDLQKVYDALRKGEGGFKTVVIDSITEAQKFSMSDIMKQARREDPDVDPDIPRMRDWGKNIEQMRRIVRAFRDLPINVIFTALAMSDKDNRGKTVYRPMLSGKLSGEVPGFVDIVSYMYVRMVGNDNKRLLLSHPSDTAMAKDRSNRLQPLIENPTMEVLYNAVTAAPSSTDSDSTN